MLINTRCSAVTVPVATHTPSTRDSTLYSVMLLPLLLLGRDGVLTRAGVVLTKVFVYCGIGMVATGVVPVMFEVLGWGVKMA